MPLFQKASILLTQPSKGGFEVNILFLLFLFFFGGIGSAVAFDADAPVEPAIEEEVLSFSELLKQLESEDGNARRKAAELLSEHSNAEAVEALAKAYAATVHDGFGVKAAVATTLGKIGRAEAAKTLSSMLSENDYWVRRKAAQSLGAIPGNEAVESLYRALNDEDPRVRADAVLSLGLKKIGIDKLKKALDDEDDRVVAAAYTSIDAVEGDAAREMLVAALNNKSWRVKYRAASLLAQRKDQRGFDALEKAIKKGTHIGTALREASCIGTNVVPLLAELFSDPDVGEKEKILSTIEKLDCATSTDFFYKLYVNKNADPASRVKAGTVLFDRRSQLEGDWLKDIADLLTEEDPNIIAIALQFLGENDSSDYISRIVPHASHENLVIRHFALMNLSEHAGPEYEGLFIKVLSDEKMVNVRLALETLGKIGSQKSIEAIRPLSEERKTRRFADEAIEAIEERLSTR